MDDDYDDDDDVEPRSGREGDEMGRVVPLQSLSDAGAGDGNFQLGGTATAR